LTSGETVELIAADTTSQPCAGATPVSSPLWQSLDFLKWCLIPYFTKDIKKARKSINVRAENVAKSEC